MLPNTRFSDTVSLSANIKGDVCPPILLPPQKNWDNVCIILSFLSRKFLSYQILQMGSVGIPIYLVTTSSANCCLWVVILRQWDFLWSSKAKCRAILLVTNRPAPVIYLWHYDNLEEETAFQFPEGMMEIVLFLQLASIGVISNK